MVDPTLVSAAQAAERLNCSIHELEQKAVQGEVELAPFQDQRRYRIVTSRQGAKGNADASAATAEHEREPKKPAPGDVNVALLLEQNEDRKKLVHVMEKNHALEIKALEGETHRLSRQRLAAITVLGILIVGMTISGSMVHDGWSKARADATDMALMASHRDQQYRALDAQMADQERETNSLKAQLQASQLAQAQSQAKLSLQEAHIYQAKRMINQMMGVETPELSASR